MKTIAFISTFIASIAILITGVGFFLSDKIINTQISNKYLGVLERKEAIQEISKIKLPKKIVINDNYVLLAKDFNLEIDAKATANIAFYETRKWQTLFETNIVKPVLRFENSLLEEQISLIAGQVYIPPVYPNIIFENNLEISTGVLGFKLNNNLLIQKILDTLANSSENQIAVNIELTKIGAVLGAASEDDINNNYDLLKNKNVNLIFEDFELNLDGEGLLKLHHNLDGTAEGPFANLLIKLVEIEREPQNPIFKEESGRVVEFSPSKDGIAIREKELQSEINSAISNLLTSGDALDIVEIKIPVLSTEPKIKTGSINNYGISELIGKGSSTFKGSIPSRVHNVALAAEKMNGTLIAPGEVFSFNNIIGDISVYAGFKQSYVIKDNQTVLGDGGGVCQVSTTIFRAALNTGLEIVERNPHSYRVGYYEQDSPAGIDATIYTPTVDLKFKNNTENHILIQTVIDIPNRKLDFEFYGTSDGREIIVGKPVITNVTEPPEDLYTDDPTRPAGFIEQVDYSAWGAKVNFDYKVVRDGRVLQEKTFYTNYRAWQAKFIRGTGPAI